MITSQLNQLHLQWPHFPMRSHYEVLDVKASTYLFFPFLGRGEAQFNPTTWLLFPVFRYINGTKLKIICIYSLSYFLPHRLWPVKIILNWASCCMNLSKDGYSESNSIFPFICYIIGSLKVREDQEIIFTQTHFSLPPWGQQSFLWRLISVLSFSISLVVDAVCIKNSII